MVIALTAKGLTTGEVEAHLAEVCGTNVSRETISMITDRVLVVCLRSAERALLRAVRQ
jgi:putative transposase